MSDISLPQIQGEDHSLPVLPLKDVVVYPHMVIPLFVGREKSINALEAAMAAEQKIFLVAQHVASEENPTDADLYKVGTVSSILQLLRLPDGTLKVLIEGEKRAKVQQFSEQEQYLSAQLTDIGPVEAEDNSDDLEPLVRSLLTQFDQYVKLNKKIPPEVVSSLSGIDNPGRLVDTIAAHMTMKVEDRQSVLEEASIKKRMEMLLGFMEAEMDILQVERRIRNRVKRQMEKNQREYYLTEQMKAIQHELGDIGEGYNITEDLEKQIEQAKMPKEAHDKATSELQKLKGMSPMSAEATVARNYIETLASIPWSKKTRVKRDIAKAEQALNQDHYGLDKVKERILEYLAVQERVKKVKGPILCLVGPPGVGKTSLGESVARATGRKFARVSLGGVRDEAEIRGHRRTYVGALPGKIMQKLIKVGSRNPLFLLDEIDKMSTDFRGDPSSAMLEVLDPEQNHTFNDHYLEVDYDLSDVMFIATANSLNIPAALLDRMEVIRLSGYTEDEKVNIAERYLIPKHRKASGLKTKELDIKQQVLVDIVRYYTRESGVRSLEREIAKICRKAVKELSLAKSKAKVTVTTNNLEDYLGVKRFRFGVAEEHDEIGQATGLAWTEVGGELLKIEATAVPGKGKSLSTGKLGDVMQESIQAATTVVRNRAHDLGIDPSFYEKTDLHVHVPEGATPKDGPSAGIAICTALVSVLTGRAVRSDVAMTGEITLRGEVLPIGGLKEKLLAAHRGGIKTIIISSENERDLKEIPENIVDALEVCPVKWVDEVLEIALSPKKQTDERKNVTNAPGSIKLSKSSQEGK